MCGVEVDIASPGGHARKDAGGMELAGVPIGRVPAVRRFITARGGPAVNHVANNSSRTAQAAECISMSTASGSSAKSLITRSGASALTGVSV